MQTLAEQLAAQKEGFLKTLTGFLIETVNNIGQSIIWLTTTPRRYAPVLAVATIVFFMLILPQSPLRENPYLSHLSFEPLT